jgi:hypothetical protein
MDECEPLLFGMFHFFVREEEKRGAFDALVSND